MCVWSTLPLIGSWVTDPGPDAGTASVVIITDPAYQELAVRGPVIAKVPRQRGLHVLVADVRRGRSCAQEGEL